VKVKPSVVETKADPSEVAQLLEDPTNPDALASFMPNSLKCLDKFAPGMNFTPPSDFNKVLGLQDNAPTAAQDVTVKLKSMKMDGPRGLHALAFVGGCLVVAGSALNFVFHIANFSLLHVFFSCMMIVFGFVICVLEQQKTFFPPRFRMMIHEYFLFLAVITGRGLFYVYVGMIQAAVAWKKSTINVLIGFYLIFVGFAYVFVGRSVEAKLSQLQHSLHSPTAIKRAFEKYDADRSGYLDKTEFSKLIAVLGSTLTIEEAIAAIDTNKDGKISVDELVHWFERTEEDV